MTEITVAGHTIDNPLNVWEEYAQRYSKTLATYDFAVKTATYEVTPQDIKNTRRIASRISLAQQHQIIERSQQNRHLLEAIPVDAQLQDADPNTKNGLYDAMEALFIALQGPGIKASKVSKVLHLKRPALYPILDSVLRKFYSQASRTAAARYPQRGFRTMSWAAIRHDVLKNQPQLNALRPDIAANQALHTAQVHKLSDLRLLDILAWKAQRS